MKHRVVCTAYKTTLLSFEVCTMLAAVFVTFRLTTKFVQN